MRRCLNIKLLIDILMITLLLPDYFIQLHEIIHLSPGWREHLTVSSLNMSCEQNRLHWSGTRPETDKRYVSLFVLSTAAVMPTRKPADVLNMLLHAGFCLNQGSFQAPSEVHVAARLLPATLSLHLPQICPVKKECHAFQQTDPLCAQWAFHKCKSGTEKCIYCSSKRSTVLARTTAGYWKRSWSSGLLSRRGGWKYRIFWRTRRTAL